MDEELRTHSIRGMKRLITYLGWDDEQEEDERRRSKTRKEQ